MDFSSTITSWPVSKHTYLLKVTFFGPNLKLGLDQPSIWHSVLAMVCPPKPLDFIRFRGYVTEQDSVPFHYRAVDDHSNPASSKYIELTFPCAIDGDWWNNLHAEFEHSDIFLFNPEDRDATRQKLYLRAFWEGNKEGTGALPYAPLHACDMRLRDKVSDAVTTLPAVELPLSISRDASPAKKCPPTLTPHQTNSTTRRPLYQHRRSNSARYSFDRPLKIDASTSDPFRKLTFIRTALSTIEETPEDIRSDMPLSDLAATVVKPNHYMSAGPLEVSLRGWQGQIEEMQKALATLPRARRGNYEDLKARALRGVAADQKLISSTMWSLRRSVEVKMAELAKEPLEDDQEVDMAAQVFPGDGEAMPQARAQREQEQAERMVLEMDAQVKHEKPHQSVQAQPDVTHADRAQVRHQLNAHSIRYEKAPTEEERKAALRALFNVPPHVYREYLLRKGRS